MLYLHCISFFHVFIFSFVNVHFFAVYVTCIYICFKYHSYNRRPTASLVIIISIIIIINMIISYSLSVISDIRNRIISIIIAVKPMSIFNCIFICYMYTFTIYMSAFLYLMLYFFNFSFYFIFIVYMYI